MSDYGKPMDGSEYAHGPVPAREREPSAAAKAWYVNEVQEPLLTLGVVAPVVSSEAARARMRDYDAGRAEMKREVLAEIVDMLVEEHLKPTVYDELKRRVEGL